MNVLFYDDDERRMRDNFVYFSGLDDVTFISANNIMLVNNVYVSADFVIIYDSDKIQAGDYIKGNVYYIGKENDVRASMKSFSLGAKYLEGAFETEVLHEFLKGEYTDSVKRISKTVTMIEYVMKRCRIPTHLKGYDYLSAALDICCSDKDMSSSVTKMLYPMLSKQFETTACNVERSIRNAIEQGWDAANEFYNKLFKPMPKRRPTNRAFLKAAVEYINENCTDANK